MSEADPDLSLAASSTVSGKYLLWLSHPVCGASLQQRRLRKTAAVSLQALQGVANQADGLDATGHVIPHSMACKVTVDFIFFND